MCFASLYSYLERNRPQRIHRKQAQNLYVFKKPQILAICFHFVIQQQAQSGDKTAVLQRRTASHRWHLVPQYSGTKRADWETSLLCSSGPLDQTQEIVLSIHNHPQLMRSLWSKNNYSWMPVTSLVLCSFIRSTLLPCFISACSERPRSATPCTPPWPGSSAGSRPFGPSSLSIFTEISASG